MKLDWKKLKNERFLLTLLFISGLVWIFGAFFINLSFPDSSYNFLGSSGKAKLDPKKPITQTFTAQENNLNQIKIIVGNFNLTPQESIDFELADVSCESTVAKQSITYLTLDPHIYYHFNFPLIADSAGQTYCLKITYFSPVDRGIKRPYIATSDGEQFRGFSYTNEGNQRIYENKTLQMRPSYGTGSVLGDLHQLNNRISQYKPMFVKGWTLTFLFGTLLI